MEKLALQGGLKTIESPFKRYNSIGNEEIEAVNTVMKSGILSQYLGTWSDDFYGGPNVRAFETEIQDYFGVKHAITVNSWTSGLIAAVGAIGIEPGDEVIVTPWTMSATAAAILHWNAIPVFADIDAATFNLDPNSIEDRISPRTKAIMVADIFGQSADLNEIMSLADRYGLKVISDSAQSPGAKYQDRFAGTCAHVGGFSLNYHKHIHTGEGGILVTNDSEIAQRLQLIRNHAEAVVGGMKLENLVNLIGFNFRLGEIECAIGRQQLKKLAGLAHSREVLAVHLSEGLSNLPGLLTPIVRGDRTHVYYVFALQLDSEMIGIDRDLICDALEAEGVPLSRRYQNIHLLPAFQQRIAFGRRGFPWNSSEYTSAVSYQKGICPIAEEMQDEKYLGINMCAFDFELEDIDLLVRAFHKVWANLDQLR